MPVSININANWHNESNLVAYERVSAFKDKPSIITYQLSQST